MYRSHDCWFPTGAEADHHGRGPGAFRADRALAARRGGHALAALVSVIVLGCGEPEPGIPIDGLRIFVTSTTQTADLGGIAGADALCAGQAAEAGLDGEFKAWLSTLTSSVSERLTQSPEPYVRVDGRLIADGWDDLVDGSIAAPVALDATGSARSGEVWTGTLANGESNPDDDCAGFTSSALGNAQCGATGSTTAAWTENITPACATSLRLYCVEQ